MVHKVNLKDKMFKLEPKLDLLHDIMGYGNYEEVTETSDGFFLGRPKGDIGFNAFLGKPSDVSKARTKMLYSRLNPQEKALVDFKIITSRIKRRDIGLS